MRLQRSELVLLWTVLAGVILISNDVSCLRGSALVAELKAKAKAALNAPTETVVEVVTVENNSTGNVTNVTVTKTKSLLSGIPQKDYIYDPNLPRELNGQNLTDYPFYSVVPEDIDFKCDGLHDGFYASVPHKCQLYHHCLFGTRYDFLCANYTAFDQKTFICHFVSEVDCDNSPKYYKRNEELYKEATTVPPPSTTKATTTTTTLTPTSGQPGRPRRRRPYRRRRPVYEYYYDDQYDDDDYYDEDLIQSPRRKPNRKHRPQGNYRDEDDADYDSASQQNSESKDTAKPSVRPNGPGVGTVYDRPRVPPKIRRPVPINERDKYDYTQKTSDTGPPPTQEAQKPRSQNKKQQRDDDYYDEDYEEEQPKPKKSKPADYETEPRRSNGHHRTRQHNRRRPDRFSDDYEDEERPLRPSRKQSRYDNHPRSSRPSRGGHRGYSRDDAEEAVPAERPGYISGGRLSSSNRKRLESDHGRGGSRKNNGRPIYEDEEDEEEYYDEDDESFEQEATSRRNHRPGRNNGKGSNREDDYEDDTRGRQTHQNGNRYKNSGSSSKSFSHRSPLRDETATSLKNSEKSSETHDGNGRPASKSDTAKSKDIIQDYDKEEDYEDEYEEKPTHETKKGSGRPGENIKSPPHENSNVSSGLIDDVLETKDPGKFLQHSANYRSSGNSEQTFTSRSNNKKTALEEITTSSPKLKTSSTATYPDSEYDDESSRYSNFRPKIEMKARIVPPTPLLNNYRKSQTTTIPTVDESKELFDSNDRSHELLKKSNDKQDKEYVSQSDNSEEKVAVPVTSRPLLGVFRRPIKITTTDISTVESTTSSLKTTPSIGSNFRRPIKVSDDDKLSRKNVPTGLGQSFRRVKIESSKSDNSDNAQQKVSNQGLRRPSKPSEISNPGSANPVNYDGTQQVTSGLGGNFRRYNKPIDLTTTELSVTEDSYIENIENQPSGPDNAVKKIKITESDVKTFEVQNQPATTNLGGNFKRPFQSTRPVDNISTNVDELPKSAVSYSAPTSFRRTNKQPNLQDTPSEPTSEDYVSSTLTPSGIGGNYRRPEPGAMVNLRSNFGYFSPKRGKRPIEETSSLISETFPRQGARTNKDAFPKQPLKIDITAPGPSAPDSDPTTAKSNFRNDYSDAQNPVAAYSFDIADEEYDVTLNDALQPSTLHPTRSLVDYQQNRLKSRGFQPAVVPVPQTSAFSNRQTSFLLPAASQQYVTRIQSTYPQTKSIVNSENTRYIGRTHDKIIQIAPQVQQEYEAVVISAPSSQQWNSQPHSRPTEWLW